jgi:type IV fimbrial biogenesis protein FimT
MRHILSPRGQRGLTLVEIGVVVAVTAILASIAAPALGRLVEGRRLEAAAVRLSTDLQFARQEAVARGRAVRLSWHEGVDAGCWLIHTGERAQCHCEATGRAACDGDAEPIKTVALPRAERIAVSANVGSMLFDPLLGTVTPTGTWRLSADSGRAIHHVVNVIGRVRSCSPQGAVAGHPAC